MSRLLSGEEVQEFRKIIDTYEPNNEVLELFAASRFTAIAGPAGAGKDTLRNALISKYPDLYVPIISTTTRPQRDGEVDGETYHFREVEFVQQELNAREYFQAALVHSQQISCLHIDEIKKLNELQTGLSILIPYTIAELTTRKSDLQTLFLIPPNIDTLRERVTAERVIDEAEVTRRMQAASQEIVRALQAENYYCVVTDTIDNVTEKAHSFIQSGKMNTEVDEYSRGVMRMILEQLV